MRPGREPARHRGLSRHGVPLGEALLPNIAAADRPVIRVIPRRAHGTTFIDPTTRSSPRSRRIAGSVASLALASSLLAALQRGQRQARARLVHQPRRGRAGRGRGELLAPTSTRSPHRCSPRTPASSASSSPRRLAAEDPSIDLMSLDPPFTAEFADAGFLAELPQDAKAQLEEQGTFQGAMDAATWEDKLVVFPFWSNTQVLWYRKSFVDKAGLDMSQPVTWDQIIQAAADNGGKIGVQANKYEGYVVWINALISGAGGSSSRTPTRASTLDLDHRQRRRARTRPRSSRSSRLRRGSCRPQRLQRGHRGLDLRRGRRLVHGQLDLHLPQLRRDRPDVAKDIGYTRYPQTVEGEESRPPYGGIGIGVSELLRPQGPRAGGRRLPGGAGEPGHQRRDDRQHAGQHRRLRLPRAGRALPR